MKHLLLFLIAATTILSCTKDELPPEKPTEYCVCWYKGTICTVGDYNYSDDEVMLASHLEIIDGDYILRENVIALKQEVTVEEC